MSDPKLHHYVPQFYLRRFADKIGRLWVWDRDRDRVFATSPSSVAAESNFYFLPEFAKLGHDPLTMERQFSDLEGQVSIITDQWLEWIRKGKPGDPLVVPEVNREMVSLFVALQFLRTADAREILAAFAIASGHEINSEHERRALHTELLWTEEVFASFADRVKSCSWLFGYNDTSTPFITSDNPVAFKTADHRQWLKAGVISEGTYITYPLAPDVVMYCYPNEGVWLDAQISRFDCQISPIKFNDGMVESDNTAQVFMASRFVISSTNSFTMERGFAKTIGTDIYASKDPDAG